MARLTPRAASPPAPSRVVIDVRPLQEPERTPITAEYLGNLLAAFADEPLAGESFVVVSRAMRADPTAELEQRGLPVVGRRTLPPTSRAFRSTGLTLDSFLLRGAEIGAAGGGQRVPGASAGPPTAPAVFHTAGGAVPLASRLPVVATLLDLAPWELPQTYAASPAARFGHRLRRRVLHDAARVIVCSRATAAAAGRRLHLEEDKLAVIPLAVGDDFRAAGRDVDRRGDVRQRLGLPKRYLCFCGRYDARKDIATLFAALRERPDAPPLVMAGMYDADSDEATLRHAARSSGLGERVIVMPALAEGDRAAVIAGATAFVYPALSEATGLRVLEAVALGVPVICSRAGALPEIVGGAGIIVEPRDARRLASAIDALGADGALAQQLRRAAQRHAAASRRTWRDVARETRQAYAGARGAARSPISG